jgi:small-conductance mechanosensitive channel
MNLMDLLEQIPKGSARHLYTLVILVAIFIAYKALSRLISRTGRRLELEPHAMNAFRLILRVASVFSALYILFHLYNISTTVFVSGSALLGALLGFGSSQTINNIVAGFYVLISQPFKVKDYVKIGDLEGQVEEISINYTNLYTPTFNLLKVPNTQVMNSRILNLTHEGFIKYTFTIGFDHAMTNQSLMDNCIQPAVDDFHQRHLELQLRKPEAYLDSGDRLGKSFLIRIFIPKGEAKTLYTLRPELLDMIMERWYGYKAQ